jgi:hypothetical protein
LKELFGGPDRDRTDDLFHAMEARSQLRHRPTSGGCNFSIFSIRARFVNPASSRKSFRFPQLPVVD